MTSTVLNNIVLVDLFSFNPTKQRYVARPESP